MAAAVRGAVGADSSKQFVAGAGAAAGRPCAITRAGNDGDRAGARADALATSINTDSGAARFQLQLLRSWERY